MSAINPHCKALSCQSKAILSKLNGKIFDLSLNCFKNGVSIWAFNHRSCSKYVPTRQFKRNSIWRWTDDYHVYHHIPLRHHEESLYGSNLRFYRFIWNLFYAEYAIFPFV